MLRLVIRSTRLVARVVGVDGNLLQPRMTYATFRNDKLKDIVIPFLKLLLKTVKNTKLTSDEAKQEFSPYELVLEDYVKSAKDLSDLSLQKESLLKQYGNPQFNEHTLMPSL